MTDYTPGEYEILAPAVITNGVDRMSEKMDRQLKPGERVSVVEVKTSGDRVRAELDAGGWISIESTCKKNWKWAKPVDAFSGHEGEKMFEGTIMFNQIWVPAIIYSTEDKEELSHRAVIRNSAEMIEGYEGEFKVGDRVRPFNLMVHTDVNQQDGVVIKMAEEEGKVLVQLNNSAEVIRVRTANLTHTDPGHAGREVKNLPNEHVRINGPITPSEAGNYAERPTGRVQPPVSLNGERRTPDKRVQKLLAPDVQSQSKEGRNFFCALTACTMNPYEEDDNPV